MASLALTSLVAGLAYYKASCNKDALENISNNAKREGEDAQVESYRYKIFEMFYSLTWTNPITASVNIVCSIVQCCKGETSERRVQ